MHLHTSTTTTPAAILFDLDGTLAHTAPDLAAAANMLCEQIGEPTVPDETLYPHASAGTAALINVALNVLESDPRFPELRTQFLKNYENNIANKTYLFDGVVELLRKMSDAGIKWGIVTNKPSKYTNLLVPLLALHDASCVISGDTTAHAKPHPLPLLEAARRLDVDPKDCWYVGDDHRDIVAAKAAGMRSIAANWGYGKDIHTWGADVISDKPVDVF